MKKATNALHRHFESCMVMTQRLISAIPLELWASEYNGAPVWYQVYHFVYFLDVWFRMRYISGDRSEMVGSFDERLHAEEFATEVPEELLITREEMQDYLVKIHEKTLRVFASLNDRKLGRPLHRGYGYVHMDILAGQIRHVIYNIGYLNAMLRERGLPASDWVESGQKFQTPAAQKEA